MSVKLNGIPSSGLSTTDLQDGQLAVIMQSVYAEQVGIVVQRIGTRLQSVGKTKGHSWDIGGPTFKLRLLEVGETIEVTGN